MLNLKADDLRTDFLKIKVKDIDELDFCKIFYLLGSIDNSTASILQEEINKALAIGTINFIFDMEDVKYITSQSIGVFANLRNNVKQYKGDIAFLGLQGRAFELFTILGFYDYFIVTNDFYEAISEIRIAVQENEKEEKSIFPLILACPICGTKLRAKKSGHFSCSVCKNNLMLSEAGQVSLG